MQDRADLLQDGFLLSDARLRSNQTEIVVKTQNRRVFLRNRLPSALLADPYYWEIRQNLVVTTRSLVDDHAEELQLTEPF